MNFENKIDSLSRYIREGLTPLINSDYALLDLHYFSNIGDTLIWEGAASFLSTMPYRCLQHSSAETFRWGAFPKDVLLILQGGGNFGDFWRSHQDFRLEIIKRYPDNRILIFPQTVFYENEATLKSDAELMAKHANLTICARDAVSFGILKKHFSANNILMLPDMAFCIPPATVSKYRAAENQKTLLLKRTDKELVAEELAGIVGPSGDAEILDWPSFERASMITRFFEKALSNRGLVKNKMNWLIDLYADKVLRPYLVRTGVRFISPYKTIYTTRLHASILSILLHKEHRIIDITYGKITNFFDTWLADLEGVSLARRAGGIKDGKTGA